MIVGRYKLDSGWWWYSSYHKALVAQMVERKTLNLVVVGSSPTSGDMELPMRSPRSRNGALRLYSLVAEHLTCNEKVRGSTPRGGKAFFFAIFTTAKSGSGDRGRHTPRFDERRTTPPGQGRKRGRKRGKKPLHRRLPPPLKAKVPGR